MQEIEKFELSLSIIGVNASQRHLWNDLEAVLIDQLAWLQLIKYFAPNRNS